MAIDVIFGLMMLVAIVKGWKKGAIVAIFMLLSVIVGLAAAMKFAATVAHWLQSSTTISTKWLPVLAFLMVFLGVVMASRIAAAFIETVVDMVFLGFVNNVAGAFLYMLFYTLSFSVILFFMVQLRVISENTLNQSHVYALIEPCGPWVLNGLGHWVPFFKDLFKELQQYFGNLSVKLTHS